MENQKKKLKLEDLHVESFVTSVDATGINGGTSWWTTVTTTIFLVGDAPQSAAACDTVLDEVVVTP